MKQWRIQLMDHVTRKIIEDTGGAVMVVTQGTYDQVALLDSTGASASNPSSLTNGKIEFFTANTVTQVDLYGMAPGGEWFVAKAIDPSGDNEIYIDTNQIHQVARIPYSHADVTAATEDDTGFDMPENAQILPWGMGIDVNTGETHATTAFIDVGFLSTESLGDADGLMDGVLIGTANSGNFVSATVGFKVGSVSSYVDLTGGDQEFTLGVLLVGSGTKAAVSEGNNTGSISGFYLLQPHICDGTTESITYTMGSAAASGDGLIVIPYLKPPT